MSVLVPPIKCQGIKTKLVPLILRTIDRDPSAKWIEPFLGSGVVALNVAPATALLADSNPHVVSFYKAVQDGRVDGRVARDFLQREGEALARRGQDYYYEVRERFNRDHAPLDFLFLNRSCFNGLIRFNREGRFNVPFGHKPNRFARAYVTKIVNQIELFRTVVASSEWRIECQDFVKTIAEADRNDFIYCDPPYLGRHVDYYDSWNEQNEQALLRALSERRARFLLSTWHSNQHRRNEMLASLWGHHHITLQPHFYHVGAREENRKAMLEALVTNYPPPTKTHEETMHIDSFQTELLMDPLAV